MKKRSFLLAFVLVLITMLTGCFKKDGTEDLKAAVEKAKKLENFTLNTKYDGDIYDEDYLSFSIRSLDSKDIIVKEGNYKVKETIEYTDFNGSKKYVEYVEKEGEKINKYTQENGIWTSKNVNNIDLFGSLENLINKADSIEKEKSKGNIDNIVNDGKSTETEDVYVFNIYAHPIDIIDFLNNIKIFGETATVEGFSRSKEKLFISVICDKDLNLVAIDIDALFGYVNNDVHSIKYIYGDKNLSYNGDLRIYVKNVNGVKESDVEVPAEAKNIASVQNNTTNVPVTNSSNNTTKVPVTNNTNVGTQNKTNLKIMFDSSKIINNSKEKYTLASQGNAGMWVTVDSTQKVLTFNFTPSKVSEFYSLNWTSKKNDVSDSIIKFNKKIVDIYFGEIGQDQSGDTLFILLEDGTIEYIPIVHMFNHTQAEVVSYGKIKGVNNVVKFSLANTSAGATTLGIKSDGSFYDLGHSLKDTGNY